jgi:hypothetical protein
MTPRLSYAEPRAPMPEIGVPKIGVNVSLLTVMSLVY